MWNYYCCSIRDVDSCQHPFVFDLHVLAPAFLFSESYRTYDNLSNVDQDQSEGSRKALNRIRQDSSASVT